MNFSKFMFAAMASVATSTGEFSGSAEIVGKKLKLTLTNDFPTPIEKSKIEIRFPSDLEVAESESETESGKEKISATSTHSGWRMRTIFDPKIIELVWEGTESPESVSPIEIAGLSLTKQFPADSKIIVVSSQRPLIVLLEKTAEVAIPMELKNETSSATTFSLLPAAVLLLAASIIY